jgi:hypothetical protein
VGEVPCIVVVDSVRVMGFDSAPARAADSGYVTWIRERRRCGAGLL